MTTRCALVGALILAAGVASAGPSSRMSMDEAALARITAPPLGLPAITEPADNPATPAKIALGRKLFFDRRLSVNGTMSCAMCHIPEQGFTNNELETPIGVEGRSLRRNAPTILNVVHQASMFHDGRDGSLEEQALRPLTARDEMANPSLQAVIARIEGLSDYAGLLETAFGAPPSPVLLARAIAAWERTMVAAASPFDRWFYGGEADALSDEQIRGFVLFTGRANCAGCHLIGRRDALFTDHAFHDTGIGHARDVLRSQHAAPVPIEIAPGVRVPVSHEVLRTIGDPPQPDAGRFEVTHDPADRYRFKTPTLRNVALTAPYMHDGSLGTLGDVVRFYARGGVSHDGLDPLIRPLDLNAADIDALVAFLESLTGDGIEDLVTDARSAGLSG